MKFDQLIKKEGSEIEKIEIKPHKQEAKVLSSEDEQNEIEEKNKRKQENDKNIEKVKNDILKKFGVENKEIVNKIKEGIDFVFNQNPELLSVGSKEEYSKYLDNIFPESKVKDIVYHGTNMKLDDFKFRSLGLTSAHFIDNKEFARLWAEERTKFREEGSPEVYAVVVKILNNENDWHDGVIKKYDNDGEVTGNEITMYREEDVHLLGSKKDLENFKEFVSKNKEN